MRTVVLVGQCGIDGPRLQSEISQVVGEVGFEQRSGVQALRKVKEQHPDLKVMLVSDYPEAQQEAVQAGAIPGFGKADIGSPKVEQTICQALS
jgi:DNA-binding NarL/FixJ family response regulator